MRQRREERCKRCEGVGTCGGPRLLCIFETGGFPAGITFAKSSPNGITYALQGYAQYLSARSRPKLVFCEFRN